jgi:hypothetical protein
MGKGIARYECECGGQVTEDWDWYGTDYYCDKCDNPKPAKKEKEVTNSKHQQSKINFN